MTIQKATVNNAVYVDNRLLPYSSLKKMMTKVVAHLNTGCYWLFEKSANI